MEVGKYSWLAGFLLRAPTIHPLWGTVYYRVWSNGCGNDARFVLRLRFSSFSHVTV